MIRWKLNFTESDFISIHLFLCKEIKCKFRSNEIKTLLENFKMGQVQLTVKGSWNRIEYRKHSIPGTFFYANCTWPLKIWKKYFLPVIHNNLCELTPLEHKFKRWFCTQKPVLNVRLKDFWYTKINGLRFGMTNSIYKN